MVDLDKYGDLLTVNDLMEIFDVSKATIYKEIKSGKFGTPIRIGRAIKISKRVIVNIIFQSCE